MWTGAPLVLIYAPPPSCPYRPKYRRYGVHAKNCHSKRPLTQRCKSFTDDPAKSRREASSALRRSKWRSRLVLERQEAHKRAESFNNWGKKKNANNKERWRPKNKVLLPFDRFHKHWLITTGQSCLMRWKHHCTCNTLHWTEPAIDPPQQTSPLT